MIPLERTLQCDVSLYYPIWSTYIMSSPLFFPAIVSVISTHDMMAKAKRIEHMYLDCLF